MKLIIYLVFLFLLNSYAQEVKMESIFNGKDFSAWNEPKKNIWWKIKDGVLICKNGPKKKGSTLYTNKKYKNFVLQLDFKIGEGRVDSGIFIRNNDQIQIGISGSLKRDMTCSPYIPGKGYPKEAKGVKELLKVKDWNTLKIKAVGPVYTIWLNGQKVNEYNSKTAKEEGPIGIQLHQGRTMEIHFRNISLGKLD